MRYVAITLLATAFSGTLSADEDWPYVIVSCDTNKAQISVKEESASSISNMPLGSDIQGLYDLTELKTVNGNDLRVPKSTYKKQCNLGGAKYRIQIVPWKFNARINGMCGGYSPSTQLSVWRENQLILDRLIFGGFCNPPDSELGISEVHILEKQKQIIISANEDRITFQRTFTIEPSGQITREAIGASTRSGDTGVDLWRALKRNDLASIRDSLKRGADVNSKDTDGWTPLLRAASLMYSNVSPEIIQLLLDHGANIEAIDPFNRTPLILTAWSRNLSAMALLIKNGADVNAVDNHGQSALIAAATRGDTKQIEMLLKAGANADFADKKGRTALSYAFEANSNSNEVRDYWGAVKLLLAAGADLEKRDHIGNTPVSWISRSGICAVINDEQIAVRAISQASNEDLKKIRAWSITKDCYQLTELIQKKLNSTKQ